MTKESKFKPGDLVEYYVEPYSGHLFVRNGCTGIVISTYRWISRDQQHFVANVLWNSAGTSRGWFKIHGPMGKHREICLRLIQRFSK